VYVSGQVPMSDRELIASGKVGADVSPERANELIQRCALAALAAIDTVAGLAKVVRIVKVVGFVASSEGFTDQAGVINGASDVFVAVFGKAGRHARTSSALPNYRWVSPVEIEVVVEVSD
jgi:enamine deaminase RidA (YjgF/YER057c/UK114 family)